MFGRWEKKWLHQNYIFLIFCFVLFFFLFCFCFVLLFFFFFCGEKKNHRTRSFIRASFAFCSFEFLLYVYAVHECIVLLGCWSFASKIRLWNGTIQCKSILEVVFVFLEISHLLETTSDPIRDYIFA